MVALVLSRDVVTAVLGVTVDVIVVLSSVVVGAVFTGGVVIETNVLVAVVAEVVEIVP